MIGQSLVPKPTSGVCTGLLFDVDIGPAGSTSLEFR